MKKSKRKEVPAEVVLLKTGLYNPQGASVAHVLFQATEKIDWEKAKNIKISYEETSHD